MHEHRKLGKTCQETADVESLVLLPSSPSMVLVNAFSRFSHAKRFMSLKLLSHSEYGQVGSVLLQ